LTNLTINDDTKSVSADSATSGSEHGGSELSWLDNMELYDVLDASGMESIGFREFCALTFLVAAAQSNQLVQCLYEHAVLFFDIVGGGQQAITGERAKVLARMMGCNEQLIDSTAEEVFEFSQSSLVYFEDFHLLYFEIFKAIQPDFKAPPTSQD